MDEDNVRIAVFCGSYGFAGACRLHLDLVAVLLFKNREDIVKQTGVLDGGVVERRITLFSSEAFAILSSYFGASSLR